MFINTCINVKTDYLYVHQISRLIFLSVYSYCRIYAGESDFVIDTSRFDSGSHSLAIIVSTLSGQSFTQDLVFIVEGQSYNCIVLFLFFLPVRLYVFIIFLTTVEYEFLNIKQW